MEKKHSKYSENVLLIRYDGLAKNGFEGEGERIDAGGSASVRKRRRGKVLVEQG